MPTTKQKLIELAARYDELPPETKHRLGMAIGKAHAELPERQPLPPGAGGVIGRGSAR